MFKFRYAAPIMENYVGDRFKKSLIEVCGRIEYEGQKEAIDFTNLTLPDY